MKSGPPNIPAGAVSSANQISPRLTQVEARVAALEAAVFPTAGPGPSFGERLESVEERLSALAQDIVLRTNALDDKYTHKIKELVEITAELRSLLDELNEQRHFRTMGA